MYRYNELEWSWVAMEPWIFEVSFDATADLLHANATLTFATLDTVAAVRVNGQLVGTSESVGPSFGYLIVLKMAPRAPRMTPRAL